MSMRIVTLPPPSPGFIGDGHIAIQAIGPQDFAHNDPFIMLADDRLDLTRGQQAGAAHPHAGFEIATLIVDGEMRDRDEGLLRAGDVVWTTTGSGVIHNEDVEPLGKVRILQLWVTTPSASRWAPPRFEHVAREEAAVRREPGIEAIVYSGLSGQVDGGSHLNLPFTMVRDPARAERRVRAGVPASYNGFLYRLDGEVTASERDPRPLAVGQIGWLEHLRLHPGRRYTSPLEPAGPERCCMPVSGKMCRS